MKLMLTTNSNQAIEKLIEVVQKFNDILYSTFHSIKYCKKIDRKYFDVSFKCLHAIRVRERQRNNVEMGIHYILLTLRFERDANGIVDDKITKLCHVRRYSEAFR